MAGIGNAISSYTAQNIGAGKKDRVVKGYHSANGIIIVCAAIICFILEFFHKPIIEMFLGETATTSALATGNNYLLFMGWCFCLIGFKMAVDGLLRGAGDMKMFTIANLVNLIIRVALAFLSELPAIFHDEKAYVRVYQWDCQYNLMKPERHRAAHR
jgi:Na+-driven multidrug efflux pump